MNNDLTQREAFIISRISAELHKSWDFGEVIPYGVKIYRWKIHNTYHIGTQLSVSFEIIIRLDHKADPEIIIKKYNNSSLDYKVADLIFFFLEEGIKINIENKVEPEATSQKKVNL